MCISKDTTNPCGSPPSSEDEDENESDVGSDSDSDRRYRSSGEDTAQVVRKNGRVVVKFGEEMEDALKEIYGQQWPYLF